MGKKKPPQPTQTDVYNRAVTSFEESKKPTELENEMKPVSQQFMNNYSQATGRDMADQGEIMGNYRNFLKGFNPSAQKVSAERPGELGEAYGYLRETMPGYREFSKTGGYSGQDIQELRARGMAPIRSAYGNTMMELGRSRALGGGGGAPNYIAAASRAQRDMPGQMADAMTGVNAELANSIRQGRLAGLAGMGQTGATMGGLSSDEAGRMLQAQMANQGADLQAQQMGMQGRLGAMGGMQQLYGTTPGMSNMFGNQALQSYDTRAGMLGNRQQYGLGLLNAQSQALGAEKEKTPWWKTALNVAGTVAPYAALALSSRTVKHDIKRVGSRQVSSFAKKLKDLPLYTWKYNGDDTTHFGPIAEEFKESFGIGDGKTLHLADVMGVMLASAKEAQ